MEDLYKLKNILLSIAKNTHNKDIYKIVKNFRIKRNSFEYYLSDDMQIGYIQVRRIFYLLEYICESEGYIVKYYDLLDFHILIFEGEEIMSNYD